MPSRLLYTQLELTPARQRAIEHIEEQYRKLTDQLFFEDISARQMYKRLRDITFDKHTQICQLLSFKQQQLYLEFYQLAHQSFKNLPLIEKIRA